MINDIPNVWLRRALVIVLIAPLYTFGAIVASFTGAIAAAVAYVEAFKDDYWPLVVRAWCAK